MDEEPSQPADWYPTRFVRPPLWRLAVVVLAELGLGAAAIFLLHQQWPPTAGIVAMVSVGAFWQWKGSAKPDSSQEDGFAPGSAQPEP